MMPEVYFWLGEQAEGHCILDKAMRDSHLSLDRPTIDDRPELAGHPYRCAGIDQSRQSVCNVVDLANAESGFTGPNQFIVHIGPEALPIEFGDCQAFLYCEAVDPCGVHISKDFAQIHRDRLQVVGNPSQGWVNQLSFVGDTPTIPK